MGTPRKATAVLEASGAFKNHPSRARKHEPNTGRGIGPAPEWLDDAERALWDEIVGDCAPGVFQSSDRTSMLVLVRLLHEWRTDYKGFGGRKYPVLLALLARFGMTPCDRARLTVVNDEPKEKPKSGLASFRR